MNPSLGRATALFEAFVFPATNCKEGIARSTKTPSDPSDLVKLDPSEVFRALPTPFFTCSL
jgi:hypothetical protein